MIKKIEDMRQLEKDWVPGAVAICEEAINFSLAIAKTCTEDELKGWEFAPYPNGTVFASYGDGNENHSACLSIGKTSATAFVKVYNTYRPFERVGFASDDDAVEFFKTVNGALQKYIAEAKQFFNTERDKAAAQEEKNKIVRKQVKKRKTADKKNKKANRKNRAK